MHPVGIIALLLYTLGAYAYGAVLVLSLQDLGRRGWAGQRRRGTAEAEIVGGLMMLQGTAWFLANLVSVIVQLGPRVTDWPFHMAVMWLAFVWPPLIMHVTIAEIDASGRAGDATRPWRRLVWLAYPAALIVPTWATLVFGGVLSASGRTIDIAINGGLTAAFVFASLFSVGLSKRFGQTGETPRKRVGDRAMTMMFVATVVIFLLMPLLAVGANISLGAALGRTIEISARTLPLAFLFVGAYFQSRFEFFDILVKRGLTLFVTLAALVLFFAATRPLFSHFGGTPSAHWVFAVSLLPIVLALPWIHARLSAALDRRWLGRRFSTVDAVKHFVGTLRSATTGTQLAEQAERALTEIFDAPARVHLDGEAAAEDFEIAQRAAVTASACTGEIRLGPRNSEAPYFSEDLALLASLADVLASAADNLHLQARRREQEQLAQELTLHASRSELKALRAQINPHFLFNALNAIAGLIPRNPDRADRTIEQLADVFRYALRGAESEWAVLEDEVDFVRAYLEVERARFGERLKVEIAIDEAARRARVPTMMLQTLVENAVKHGLSQVIGEATIGVAARVEGGRLVIAVSDNGEGFRKQATRHDQAPRGGGYGLANIRQRLAGYFGEAAALILDRDEARALTVVSIAMPLQ